VTTCVILAEMYKVPHSRETVPTPPVSFYLGKGGGG
jgi:hypothetical protein